MVILLVVIGREGLFKVRPRADVIALEPASHAKDVVWPARRRQSRRVSGVTQGCHRHLAHRCKVGTDKAYQPHAVMAENLAAVSSIPAASSRARANAAIVSGWLCPRP